MRLFVVSIDSSRCDSELLDRNESKLLGMLLTWVHHSFTQYIIPFISLVTLLARLLILSCVWTGVGAGE